MNPLLPRTALLVGLAIAALNVIFASQRYGLSNLPAWFFLVQLTLIPVMVFTLRTFARASLTHDFMRRAALYFVGWMPPYLIYNLSSELLRPDFSWQLALTSSVLFLLIFSVVFALIRRPAK